RPELKAILDATPNQHLTFLTTEGGRQYSGNYFSLEFRRWCKEAGLPSRCISMDFGRRAAADWRRPVAALTRSPPGADTRRCMRSRATPRQPTRNGLREMPSRAP